MPTISRTRPSGLRSYAAVWREGCGPLYTGRIELGPAALRLCGTGQACVEGVRQFAYDEVVDLRIERGPEERLLGGPVLVLKRRTEPPVHVRTVGTVDGPGTLNELANFIGALRAEAMRGGARVAVIVPLKDGAREQTRRLIEQGPPFDPGRLALERHHVFLGEHEAIFLFEGTETPSIESLAADPAVWDAAAGWEACIAGPPRVISDTYSWVRTPAA